MSSQALQVLLVDQNDDRLSQWTQWLSEVGFDVDHAKNQTRTVQSIEQDCPHFLVISHGTGIDAISVCRWVRKHQLPNYVYVVVSDNASTTQTLQAGRTHCCPTIPTKIISSRGSKPAGESST